MTASEETQISQLKPQVRNLPSGSQPWARRTVVVAAIYGGAIVTLLIGELLLARHIGVEAFGGYQLVRQAIPVITVLALLGYDQSLTREVALRSGQPIALDLRHVRLAAIAFIIGAAGAAYLFVDLKVPLAVAFTLPICASAVVLSSLISGVMRAGRHTAGAALTQQGGRLLAGMIFVAAWPVLTGLGAAVVLSTSSLLTALAGVAWMLKRRETWAADPSEHRLMRRLGVGFSLSMLSLAAGDWLDQALIARLSNDLGVVGGYAQMKLIAVYPILSIGSVLGFVMLPELARRRDTISRPQVQLWMMGGLAGSVVAAALVAPTARLALQWLFGVTYDWHVVIVLATVGALRLYYVLPSALLGAKSTPRVLTSFGGLCLVGLAVQALVTLVSSDAGPMLAAAYGLATATVLRVGLASMMSLRLVDGRTAPPNGSGP